MDNDNKAEGKAAQATIEANAPDGDVSEPNTEGPGDVYYGRRQELRETMTSAEVNEVEEGLKADGKLFESKTETKTVKAKGAAKTS